MILLNSNLSKPLSFTLYSGANMDYAYSNVGSLSMSGTISLNVEDYNLLTVTSGTVNITKTFSDGTKTTVSVTVGNNTTLSDVVSVTVAHSSSVCTVDTWRSTALTAKFTIE